MNKIRTNHGEIALPAFMPDATYGSIKSVAFKDALEVGVRELVTTTLHIENKVGSTYIRKLGGLHKFFGWDRPILTDSGGWQVFSLINKQKQTTKNFITDAGCSFVDPESGTHTLLTPEASQQIQYNLGSDIVTALDDPILGTATYAERKECVRINTEWAKRSKKSFAALYGVGKTSRSKPLITCVIQGGNDFELRRQSAQELLELDYDIYNFGGMPLRTPETWRMKNKEGFFHEMLHYVAELIPQDKVKYAMGVGQPDDIAFCVSVGWQLFDTVLPTRNARHGYFYVNAGQGDTQKSFRSLAYDVLRLKGEKYKDDMSPLDEKCTCECCTTVSRAYLRHLIRIREPAGYRLGTIHNLKFYSDWMEKLRKEISTGHLAGNLKTKQS